MKTSKIYVEGANYDAETNEYASVRIPEPFSVTILVSNQEHFIEVFDDVELRQMILQGLRDSVMNEYNGNKTFPKHATAPYKATGDAIFCFDRLERDEWGECLVAYYEFETTVS